MAHLITSAHIAQPDDFYAALIRTHDGLSKAESDAMNARLILLLANHIGDLAVLQAALDAARAPKDFAEKQKATP